MQDVCVECEEEGQYTFLEPASLHHWELPPELPAFRELAELPAIERLAMVYLRLAYLLKAEAAP